MKSQLISFFQNIKMPKISGLNTSKKSKSEQVTAGGAQLKEEEKV